MQSLSEVSLPEFNEALTPSGIRLYQMIYSSIAACMIIFLFVIFIISQRQIDALPRSGSISFLNILSILNIIFIITSIITSKAVSNGQFSKQNLKSAVNLQYVDNQGNPVQLTAAQKCFSIIRTASIIRLAILEGSAFFGLVTTMLVVLNGIGIVKPVYYVNAISIMPALVYISITFPTAGRIEKIFLKKIQNSGHSDN